MTLTLRKVHNTNSLTRPAGSRQFTSLTETVQSQGPVAPYTRKGSGFAFSTGSQYTEESPLLIPANTLTKVSLPEITFDQLKGNFEGHDFVNSGNFQPRASGDTFMLRVSMIGKATLSNTTADLALHLVGSEIDAEEENFDVSAGVPGRMNFKFLGFSAETFVANGGEFFIRTTSDAEIWDVRPLVVPVGPQ